MAIILASSLNNNYKDKDGNRWPIPMLDTNYIVTNIKKHTPKFDSVVFVANNPFDYERMDSVQKCSTVSFEMVGISFKNSTVLDNRNKAQAKKILSKADLIVLSGGRLMCQLEFFEEIGLKKILKKHKGLTIGISAGTMNLCKTVLNFPETQEDIENSEPKILNGLGFYNEIIVPHFNGKTKSYFENRSDIDVVNEILKLSKENEFLVYNDDSYILINEDKVEYYGTFYKIKNEKIVLAMHNEIKGV